MQYMLMCCFEQNSWEKLPETERDKIMQEYGTLMQDLVKSGQFRAGAQLYPTSSATTVRMKNGKPIITDGPFAETKEQLGGYHVIECQNLNEALSIAARIPTLPVGGTIEVRPVMPSRESEFPVS